MKEEERTTRLNISLDLVSMDTESYQRFQEEQKHSNAYTTLKAYFDDYLAEHSTLTIPDIILNTNLNKSIVYKIFDGSRTHPDKYRLLAICIAMGMNKRQIIRALRLGNCATLNPKDPVDQALVICINSNCTSIRQIREFLVDNQLEDCFDFDQQISFQKRKVSHITLEEKYRLSHYHKIADICSHDNVYLVQHQDTLKIYVWKEHTVYDKDIYLYLQAFPNPHIPRIIECIENQNKLFIVEEYVQGESLQECIDRGQFFTEQQVCKFMITICDILEQLHHLPKPVIHRDLKPANIILEPNGYLKLSDFNTAKQYSAENDKDTIIIGTRKYAAPEQYGYQQSDPRTDIFAIGVMMNYLLTRKYPEEYIYMQENNSRNRLYRIISKCTEFSPKQRYQTVMDLRKDLQKLMGVKLPLKQRDYLPPGFRSGKIWKMLIASAGYAFLFWMGLTMDFTHSDGTAYGTIELWANRIGVLLWMLSSVAYWFNYLEIQRIFPFLQSRKNKWVGWLLFPVLSLLAICIVLAFFAP